MASLDASSWVAALRGLRNGAFYGTKIRAPHGSFVHVVLPKLFRRHSPSMHVCVSLHLSLFVCWLAAFVMTFLFQSGSFRSKLERILSMTFTHTKNLALFVGLYKGIRLLSSMLHTSPSNTSLFVHAPAPMMCSPPPPPPPTVAVALGRVIYKTLGLPLQGGHGMPAAPWHAFASGAVAAWFVWADYSGVNFQVPYAACVCCVCWGVPTRAVTNFVCSLCVVYGTRL